MNQTEIANFGERPIVSRRWRDVHIETSEAISNLAELLLNLSRRSMDLDRELE
jgi:hypothetical protein